MELFDQISEQLQKGKAKVVKTLVQQAIDEGCAPQEILEQGLLAGMNIIGEKFRKNEVFVPEVLVAARAMNMGAALLKPLLAQEGVKATGKTAGSITVELEQSEHAMNSTGKYTPAGNVAGTVAVPQHNVPVAVTLNDAQAVVGTGTGTANAEVSYVAPAKEVVVSATTGTAAQFTEGKFTAASLDHSEVTANYVDAAIVGSVADECLTFTDVATKALSASKVNSFNGGSKESDTFVANTPASFETGNVIGSITEISATVAYEKVTGVTYKKAEEAASGTCAGGTYDISASFTGTEGDVSVAGKCHDYAVKTAAFNGADVELAVGDITVAAKEVTVR